jgi:hypothetical protein
MLVFSYASALAGAIRRVAISGKMFRKSRVKCFVSDQEPAALAGFHFSIA